MTMSNLQTPFRYDFVGSFLRPEKLKKARRQFNEGKIDAAALKKVEDEAITELVSKIKEFRRRDNLTGKTDRSRR